MSVPLSTTTTRAARVSNTLQRGVSITIRHANRWHFAKNQRTTRLAKRKRATGTSGKHSCIPHATDRSLHANHTGAGLQEHMILSGGLGSSAYVREQLQRQLFDCPHPNASNIAVIPCPEPQLIVVRGLLLDQQQRLESGTLSVLAMRVARASYGVLIREMYTPALHFNEDVVPDPYDYKKKWAINQIQWLIRKVCGSRKRHLVLAQVNS